MRLLLVLLLIAMPVRAAAANWTPKTDQIARLEKKLVLPPGASPLPKYGRYYWGETSKNGKVIYGTLSLDRKPGLRVGTRRPTDYILDGGCNFVSVAYDLSKDRVTAWCNGLA